MESPVRSDAGGALKGRTGAAGEVRVPTVPNGDQDSGYALGDAALCEAASDVLDVSSKLLGQIPPQVFASPLVNTLLSLSVCRNNLTELPAAIGLLTSLKRLDVSRNHLRCVPPELGKLHNLEELTLLSNKFRGYVQSVLGAFMDQSSLPATSANDDAGSSAVVFLGGATTIALISTDCTAPSEVKTRFTNFPHLQLLDLRYNKRLKDPARAALQQLLPADVEIRVTLGVTKPGPGRGGSEETAGIVGAHACDRNPLLLRSQLEPSVYNVAVVADLSPNCTSPSCPASRNLCSITPLRFAVGLALLIFACAW